MALRKLISIREYAVVPLVSERKRKLESSSHPVLCLTLIHICHLCLGTAGFCRISQCSHFSVFWYFWKVSWYQGLCFFEGAFCLKLPKVSLIKLEREISYTVTDPTFWKRSMLSKNCCIQSSHLLKHQCHGSTPCTEQHVQSLYHRVHNGPEANTQLSILNPID